MGKAGGSTEYTIPKLPPPETQPVFRLGKDAEAKKQRAQKFAEILPVLWPSDTEWNEYKTCTNCKGMKHTELTVLDKYRRLAPLWNEYLKTKDSRKLQLGVIAATVSGKSEARQRQLQKPPSPNSSSSGGGSETRGSTQSGTANSTSNTIPNKGAVSILTPPHVERSKRQLCSKSKEKHPKGG